MTMTAETPPAPPASPEPLEPARRRITPLRVLAGLVVAAFVAMWVVVFTIDFRGDYHPAGYLTDRQFPVAAEPICAAATADVDALPPARTAKTATERADVIEQANARLTRMQDELRGVVPDTPDAVHIRQWVEDWTVYLEDRREYAAALRTDPAAEFRVTPKYGTQLSRSLDNFATVNEMPSCVTPGDV